MVLSQLSAFGQRSSIFGSKKVCSQSASTLEKHTTMLKVLEMQTRRKLLKIVGMLLQTKVYLFWSQFL
ncbi:MAG: hypothetical protein ABSC20_04960 [Candidatus Bathyarchaeia archaeon]|jgi:hypothetical protein